MTTKEGTEMFVSIAGHAAGIRALLARRGGRSDCRVHADRESVAFAPHGALDVTAAEALDGDVRAARDLGFETVVVDLRGVRLIDVAGVAVIVRWAQAASRERFAFRVIPGSVRVQRALVAGGLPSAAAA